MTECRPAQMKFQQLFGNVFICPHNRIAILIQAGLLVDRGVFQG